MKHVLILMSIVFISCNQSPEKKENLITNKTVIEWPSYLPRYDHIVVVVEENKDYHEILNQYDAPYIKEVLKKEGANFTNMYGEEHFSQGNYFWLFSGSNQGVGFVDQVPNAQTPNYPFTAPNLASQLIENGYSFKGYSESLPNIGDTVEFTDSIINGKDLKIYARKHVPWISFSNVPNGKTFATSSNVRFKDFPKDSSDFHKLPTVSFVIPNLENDMHNGNIEMSIPKGDKWLQDNLDDYYQWAKNNNSLLIITFDENDDLRGYLGLTNPMVDPDKCEEKNIDREACVDIQNKIVTIFAGAHIKAGDYSEGEGITHVNILRTIEAMYGLPKAGAQQPNALGKGISDDYIITDIFQ